VQFLGKRRAAGEPSGEGEAASDGEPSDDDKDIPF
jgi:hypothetical protein